MLYKKLAAFADYGLDLTFSAVLASAHAAGLPSLVDELNVKLADFMTKTDAFLQEIKNLRLHTMVCTQLEIGLWLGR